MTWTFLNPKMDATPLPSHVPPRTVCEESVADDLEVVWRREAAKDPAITLLADIEREPTDKVWLDLGGIAKIDRKIYTLDPIDGLTITVPAKDVEGYLETLSKRSDPKFGEEIGGRLYFTMPSMHVGVMLSVEQCDTLRERLSEISVEAAAIATIENDDFNRNVVNPRLIHAKKRPTGPIEDA